MATHTEHTHLEQINNRRAIAAFMAIAVVGCGMAYWLNDRQSTRSPDTPQQGNSSETTPDNSLQWVQRLAALENQLASNQADIPELRNQLDILKQRLSTPQPSSPSNDEIDAELTIVEQQLTDLVSDNSTVKLSKDQSLPLEQLARDLVQQEQRDDDEAVRMAVAKVTQQHQVTIRPVQLDLRDLDDQLAYLREQIADAAADRKEDRAKALRAAAMQKDLPEIRLILKPFITPGYYQPNSTSNPNDSIRTVEAKPISLSRLTRLGVLERTETGLERLHQTGGSDVHGNKRPLGVFPKHVEPYSYASEHVHESVKKAQLLLLTHGKAMVEAGLLSP